MYERFEKFIKIRDTRIRITSIVKYGISVYVDNEYRFKKERVEQCNKMNKEYAEQCNKMLESENEKEEDRASGFVERPKIKPMPTCDHRDGMRILVVTVVGESGGFVTNCFFDCDIDIDSELKKLDDYFGL